MNDATIPTAFFTFSLVCDIVVTTNSPMHLHNYPTFWASTLLRRSNKSSKRRRGRLSFVFEGLRDVHLGPFIRCTAFPSSSSVLQPVFSPIPFFLGRIEIFRMIPCTSAARFDGFHYLRRSIYGPRSGMALRLWDLLCHAVCFFRWFRKAPWF